MPRGRRFKGDPPEWSPFGQSVRAAVEARASGSVAGPRTVAELARVLGVRLSTLHLYFTCRRPMPAETAAAIRAALPEMP